MRYIVNGANLDDPCGLIPLNLISVKLKRSMKMGERYLLGITGASGVRYGTALARTMKEMNLDLDLIISEHGKEIMRFEEGTEPEKLAEYAVKVYSNNDLFSPPASGSVRYRAMVIVPCSLTTAGRINSGLGDNLITRAAQVTLKEARKLIIVPRETPLATHHLKILYNLSRSGVIVLPASPGFYHHPTRFEDLENFICQKILGLLGKDIQLFTPFSGR